MSAPARVRGRRRGSSPGRRRTHPRRLLLAVAAVLATGCTSTVAGAAWIGPDPHSAPTRTGAPGRTPHPSLITTPGNTPEAREGSDPTGTSPAFPTAEPSTPAAPVDGASGAGDPYYPTAGNGGYQVDNYDVRVDYVPETNRLAAVATITAEVTAPTGLRLFHLDLQPTMVVTEVTVGEVRDGPGTDGDGDAGGDTGGDAGGDADRGAPAAFEQRDAELVVTPATALPADSRFTTTITYSGEPGLIAGGISGLGDGGWYRTASGGALVAGEPLSASAWIPVNEHPSDPASFSLTITVPEGWEVAAAGDPDPEHAPAAQPGRHTVRFTQQVPVATYLMTVAIDRFIFSEDRYGDVQILNAFAPPGRSAERLAEQTPRVLQVLEGHFGAYPFGSYGGIYTGEDLPFALETVARPIYADWVDLDTVIHETAHQWFGNAVPIARWADICLSECFASYAPWLYAEEVEGTDLDESFRREVARRAGQEDFWRIPLVDMGAGNEFTSVYRRGPLAVHALRLEIGEAPFASLLRDWVTDRTGKPSSFADFTAAVDRAAGRDMTPFIDAWFRGATVPEEPYRTPAGLR